MLKNRIRVDGLLICTLINRIRVDGLLICTLINKDLAATQSNSFAIEICGLKSSVTDGARCKQYLTVCWLSRDPYFTLTARFVCRRGILRNSVTSYLIFVLNYTKYCGNPLSYFGNATHSQTERLYPFDMFAKKKKRIRYVLLLMPIINNSFSKTQRMKLDIQLIKF